MNENQTVPAIVYENEMARHERAEKRLLIILPEKAPISFLVSRCYFFYTHLKKEYKMFIQINENPKNKLVGDCVIRAISTFLNQDWNTTYLGLAVQGYIDADLMSADEVWGNYLIYKGYERSILPHDCPNCLTVRDFAELHPDGKYLLFVGGHVVPVINGNYYDTYDSGDRVVIYFFQKVRRN